MGGINLYTFIENDGVNLFDILGLSSERCCEEWTPRYEVEGISKEECVANYLETNHPALFGQLKEGNALGASGLGSTLALMGLGAGVADAAKNGSGRLGTLSALLGAVVSRF